MTTKIILTNHEPNMNPTADELSRIIMHRMGLMPRKEGSTDKMQNVLVEIYEKMKAAQREKHPEAAVMTVEEMGLHAGITRQTMYDYLKRWVELDLISKTSFITDGKVIIGYKLNGSTLESAFEKSVQRITNYLETSMKYVRELQKLIKNEKIAASQQKNQENIVFD
ncbi:hypothetical protein J4482_01305 [Candidatus Woesearchaeota archaeon]|nr:hypothetical protein [uncultured archaeon]AQS32052.1 hypothetical protein [uncultured archaeon]MBS3115245.1 hypothetical protein [Candidatus Woesearchaeota archaeon]